jgi:hypothetical protein
MSRPPRRPPGAPLNERRLDDVVAAARRAREERERGYREQALKLYPWVCGRCGRSFVRENLRELTVHHRDGDHDNNPADGSNWELLCLYCHDNEHRRYEDHLAGGGADADAASGGATHNPFGALKDLLKKRE